MGVRKIAVMVLVAFPVFLCAHQDKFYTFEYDNVTVRFKTGFFFEEINNAKIIGEYAAILLSSAEYDKPVLLDFIHDYGNHYQGEIFSFLNFGSEEYREVSYYEERYDSTISQNVFYPVPFSNSVVTAGLVHERSYSLPRVNRENKIVIRQFGLQFNIAETLELLNYAVYNKDTIKRLSRSDTLLSYLPDMFYCMESMPPGYIDSVKSCRTDMVDLVLETKVYKYMNLDSIGLNSLYYSYFSQHGKMVLFGGVHGKEIILDTVNQIYSLVSSESISGDVFVFNTQNQFKRYKVNTWRYPECGIDKSRLQSVPIGSNGHIVFVDVEFLRRDIYLIKYRKSFMLSPFAIYPYLAEEDLLIEDFEDFINSYRMNDK